MLDWLDPSARARLQDGQAVVVTACALLQEVADADGITLPVEREAIRRTLHELFGVDEAVLTRVEALAVARRDVRPRPTDVADALRDAPEADRRAVLEAMRRVLWSDGTAAPAEVSLAGAIAQVVGLPAADVARTLGRRD